MARARESSLLRSLCAPADGPPAIERRLDLLEASRSASKDDARRVDREIVELLVAQRARLLERERAIEELTTVTQELREIVETVTAAPLREAVFCESATVADVRLAVVMLDGSRRLLRTGPDMTLDALEPGDPVYTTQAGNLVVARGDRERTAAGEIAVVERIPDGRRLILRHHGEEIVVRRAARLVDASISAGDQVIWDSASRLALELLAQAAEDSNTLRELPVLARSALAGLDAERDRILDRFVLGVLYPDLAALYGIHETRALLLHGPPGCGKTTLMQVIASELGRVASGSCRAAVVNGGELESPWVGETQRNIRRVFRDLHAATGPKLLFIDEVDAIGRIRGGMASQHSDKALSTWLTELDGLRRQPGLAIVAATNRKELIDPALLERLSAIELHVPRPSMAAARGILRVHMPEHVPVSPNGAAAPVTRELLIEAAVTLLYAPNAGNEVARVRFRDGRERVVVARDLMSGRLCRQICAAARESAFLRHAPDGPPGVRLEDVEQAVDDALDRMATLLSPRNARAHLTDLADDAEISAIEPLRRRPRRERVRATSGLRT